MNGGAHAGSTNQSNISFLLVDGGLAFSSVDAPSVCTEMVKARLNGRSKRRHLGRAPSVGSRVHIIYGTQMRWLQNHAREIFAFLDMERSLCDLP